MFLVHFTKGLFIKKGHFNIFSYKIKSKVLGIRTEFIKHNFMENAHTYFITARTMDIFYLQGDNRHGIFQQPFQ